MDQKTVRWAPLFLLTAGIVAIFILRTLLAVHFEVPRLSDLFNSLTVLGSLIIAIKYRRSLRSMDWITAFVLGSLVAAGMLFASLFSPYPFFNIIRGNSGQALLRGFFTFAAALGGLAIMRQGGPVVLQAANKAWKKSTQGIYLGLAVGLPLAVLNVFALRFTTGQGVSWQNPGAALLDAFQPAVVEEVIYRFALWGLLWLALRTSLPKQAGALAGLLALVVHNYGHFDDLLIQAPLAALGMGLALGIVWGLPPFFLARRRGLESAIAFHWIQDVTRFLTGY